MKKQYFCFITFILLVSPTCTETSRSFSIKPVDIFMLSNVLAILGFGISRRHIETDIIKSFYDVAVCSDSGLVNKLLTLVTRDQFVMKDKVGTMNCSSTAVHVLSLHTSLLCSIIKTLCDWQFASNPRYKIIYSPSNCLCLFDCVIIYYCL